MINKKCRRKKREEERKEKKKNSCAETKSPLNREVLSHQGSCSVKGDKHPMKVKSCMNASSQTHKS